MGKQFAMISHLKMINLLTIIMTYFLKNELFNHFQDQIIFVNSYKSDGYSFNMRPGFKDN